MIRQRNENHIEEGADLLTEQFKGKLVTEGMLRAWLAQAQMLEEELWRLLWGWVLEWVDPEDPNNVYNAEGKQLDDLGAIVGQPREGREDREYIAAIKLRIRINRSKGRSSDLVEIAHIINAAMTYVEYFPLGWEVSIYNEPRAGDFIRLLAAAKAATSYGVLLGSGRPEAEVFKFSKAGTSTHPFASVYGSPARRFPVALPTSPLYRRS